MTKFKLNDKVYSKVNGHWGLGTVLGCDGCNVTVLFANMPSYAGMGKKGMKVNQDHLLTEEEHFRRKSLTQVGVKNDAHKK